MKKIKNFQSDCSFKTIFTFVLVVVIFIGARKSLNAQVGEITGPTLVCSSTAEYTLSVPSGSTIIWYTTGVVQLSSPQASNPATFSVNGNGNGLIEAHVYNNMDQLIAQKQLPIWAGPPIIENVTNEGNDWEQHVHSFAFWPSYTHISDPEYSLEVDYPGEVWNCSQAWANVYLPGDPYNYGFILESTNICGSDYYQFYFFE